MKIFLDIYNNEKYSLLEIRAPLKRKMAIQPLAV